MSVGSVIIGSVGRWVGGRLVDGSVSKWSVVGWSVVGGSVVGGFNKTLHLYPFLELVFPFTFTFYIIIYPRRDECNMFV